MNHFLVITTSYTNFQRSVESHLESMQSYLGPTIGFLHRLILTTSKLVKSKRKENLPQTTKKIIWRFTDIGHKNNKEIRITSKSFRYEKGEKAINQFISL